MTQVAYQAALARLVMDPDFRDAVAASGDPLDGYELDGTERRRLLACSRDPGIRVMRTLHKGWRLGKLIMLMPLTTTLLGDRLAAEVASFWQRPSTSLYFVPEALAFCDFLLGRIDVLGDVQEMEAVILYERAALAERMGKAMPTGPEALATH